MISKILTFFYTNLFMTIKNFLSRILFIANQMGIDLRKLFKFFRYLPKFFYDLYKFKKKYKGKIKILPCVHDRLDNAGIIKNEYFWQDLIVASWINEKNPRRHVDIGSRVDGFIAHVAAFRKIEIFDIRPLKIKIPNVICHQIDLMDNDLFLLSKLKKDYCDSISCLHVIEHFGLGRYGDEIDTQGFEIGIKNMATLLQPGGLFYLSTPIGIERVEFNANRVFDPRTLERVSKKNGLKIKKLTIFSSTQGLYEIEPNEENLSKLAAQNYNLGIFMFIKL